MVPCYEFVSRYAIEEVEEYGSQAIRLPFLSFTLTKDTGYGDIEFFFFSRMLELLPLVSANEILKRFWNLAAF